MTKEQFKVIFDRYFDDIRRYLYFRSGDATISTDLAQDTFMRIWEKQLVIEPGKDTGLLYKIAGDLYVSHVRRKTRFEVIRKEIRFTYKVTTPEEEVEFGEVKAQYEKALTDMPEKLRTVFLMNRMEQLTYREIAERLSLSEKAVEKRMSRALEKLRNEIKQQ